MKPQEEVRLGNDATMLQALIIAMSCMVQRIPALLITGPAGTGKTHFRDLIYQMIKAEWEVVINLTGQPPSTLGGLLGLPKGSETDLIRYAPSPHDVPLFSHYGEAWGIWGQEELPSADGGTLTQLLDTLAPSKRKGAQLSGFQLAPNTFHFATGNRAGLDGSTARVTPFPNINRMCNLTQMADTEAYMSILANGKVTDPDTLFSQIPWTVEEVLAIKEQIDDPDGNGVSESLVFDWLDWESKAKDKTSDNSDIFAQPESYRGQQCCTPRSLEYAMRASMLPWDFSSEVFKIMLRGYIGHDMANKCSLYIEAIKEEKDKVEAFKNGDKSKLSTDPSEQYRFCLAALQVLQSEQGVVEQGINVALHNKTITGWFTEDLLSALGQEVGNWLMDKCSYKGIDLAQCENAQRFK